MSLSCVDSPQTGGLTGSDGEVVRAGVLMVAFSSKINIILIFAPSRVDHVGRRGGSITLGVSRMAGQDSDCLPEDPSELAECVKDARVRQEEAMRRLEPMLCEIASSAAAACWLHGTDRTDFVEQAPGLFFEKCNHYDRQRGKVEAWWYRVCTNAVRDIQRSQSRRPTVSLQRNNIPTEEIAGFQAALEKALDCSEPFSRKDVEQIASWTLQNRIVLMCLTGFWNRIRPREVWEAWYSEFGLAAPFPPDEFAELADRQERTPELARLLNITEAYMAQLFCRGKKLLWELDYWERLR